MSIYTYVIVGMSGSFLLAASLLFFYTKYKRNLLLQQYKMKDAELQHQKMLLHTIISSQEKERKRIGMDLHDEVGSTLSTLRLMLENLIAEVRAGNDTASPDKCIKVINSVISSIRNISHNLSPSLKGTYGLYDALEDFCKGVNQSGVLAIAIDVKDEAESTTFDESTVMAIYRVLIELIHNTIRHAGAKSVLLTIALDEGYYRIAYEDDGIGLPAGSMESKGMGFKNIESRLDMIGAAYSIGTQAGKGFQMHISLPLT